MAAFFLIAFCLFIPFCSWAAAPETDARALEKEIGSSLGKIVPCKKIEVQVRPSKDKQADIKVLAIKLEGVVLGNMVADYLTIVYEKPVMDLVLLRRARKFKMVSAARTKVSILISARAFERYLAGQARQMQVKNYRLSVRFSPPYIECLFNVPVAGISAQGMKQLDTFEKESGWQPLRTFMKAGRVEGYAALQLKAKNNSLWALPAKAIVNHFVIPDAVLRQMQNRVNPFDRLPVPAPFRYSINQVTVQNNYLFFSN